MTAVVATGFDWLPEAAAALLSGPVRGVLLSASKDVDAKLTFVATSRGELGRVAVKVPSTDQASAMIDAEGRLLVALRRLPLHRVHDTVPRYIASFQGDGRTVLVSTVLPGTPMSVGYHDWMHTARPGAVRSDLRRAAGWLRSFQEATSAPAAPLTWAADVADQVAGRWDGHPDLDAALDRLAVAHEHLSPKAAITSAVHGDFWCGNILVQGDVVSGVVDWEAGTPRGCPLRDPARFALSYCLYLDRHTRPGHRVAGHPGLRRSGFGNGVRYGLLGTSWLPVLVRRFLADALAGLELPRSLWYDVALAGLGEIAAGANDETFGAQHLSLLAGLPARPRRVRSHR